MENGRNSKETFNGRSEVGNNSNRMYAEDKVGLTLKRGGRTPEKKQEVQNGGRDRGGGQKSGTIPRNQLGGVWQRENAKKKRQLTRRPGGNGSRRVE